MLHFASDEVIEENVIVIRFLFFFEISIAC